MGHSLGRSWSFVGSSRAGFRVEFSALPLLTFWNLVEIAKVFGSLRRPPPHGIGGECPVRRQCDGLPPETGLGTQNQG